MDKNYVYPFLLISYNLTQMQTKNIKNLTVLKLYKGVNLAEKYKMS